MAWFVCAVSPREKKNWDLCKESGFWGYTRGAAPGTVGDQLLFWVGGRGYVGYGVVVGDPHEPSDRSEAPWPGSVYRFTSVVPFKLQYEAKNPVFLRFKSNVQEVTGFNTANLQRGMSRVPDSAAGLVVELLHKQKNTLKDSLST